jgi:hypothetical protein
MTVTVTGSDYKGGVRVAALLAHAKFRIGPVRGLTR